MSENTVSTEKSASVENTEKSVPTVSSVLSDFRTNGVTDGNKSDFFGLSRKDRNLVVGALLSRFSRLFDDGNFDGAKSEKDLWSAVSGLSNKPEKVTVDPKVAIAARVAILRYAADALFGGMVAVGGIDTEMPILDESDIPDMTDEMVATALKVATFTIGTKTKENDIPTLIRTVFADRANGSFLKVSEIRAEIGRINNISVDSGWDGRINASLFKSGVSGISPVSSGTPYTGPDGSTNGQKHLAGAYRVEEGWND